MGEFPAVYGELFQTPAQTRAEFEKRGWRTIAAFQTRNPMHRSHEYLTKIAIEIGDGVLIHSLLGNLKPGDIPADVRTATISALCENYFVDNTVMQAGYPLDMRYAGPRESIAACAVSAELRLFAFDSRARSRGRGRLLRAI